MLQPLLPDKEICLRPWATEDIESVYIACQDPLIQRYTTIPSPYTREDAKTFVEIIGPSKWKRDEGASFAIVDNQTQKLLGSCSLDISTDKTAEGGYWISPSARGRNIASKAISIITQWAFSEGLVEEISLYIEPENIGSKRVAEKAGYSYIKTISNHVIIDGQRRDMELYIKKVNDE